MVVFQAKLGESYIRQGLPKITTFTLNNILVRQLEAVKIHRIRLSDLSLHGNTMRGPHAHRPRALGRMTFRYVQISVASSV